MEDGRYLGVFTRIDSGGDSRPTKEVSFKSSQDLFIETVGTWTLLEIEGLRPEENKMNMSPCIGCGENGVC